MPLKEKTINTKGSWRCRMTRALRHHRWEYKKMYYLENYWAVSYKDKHASSFDPAIPLLDVYLRETKTLCPQKSCPWMFIVPLYKSSNWKRLQGAWISEYIKPLSNPMMRKNLKNTEWKKTETKEYIAYNS